MFGDKIIMVIIIAISIYIYSYSYLTNMTGFTHQDPGFIDHLLTKKAAVSRIYLPPDANTLLVITNITLKSRNCINLTIVGKHDSNQWLSMDEAILHCSRGIDIFQWASNDNGTPDVVLGKFNIILLSLLYNYNQYSLS